MPTSQEQDRANQSVTHLSSTPQSKLLVIEREFNVPVDQLFEAFTTDKALKTWWWPKGLYSDHVEWEFREGGYYFINLKGLDSGGGGGGVTGQFEEIVNNKRIVMTDSFADEKGNAITAMEANMSGEDWPEVAYITFEFDSIDENTSKFKLSHQGIPNKEQKDCIQGWSESFDKLKKYLNDRKH